MNTVLIFVILGLVCRFKALGGGFEVRDCGKLIQSLKEGEI